MMMILTMNIARFHTKCKQSIIFYDDIDDYDDEDDYHEEDFMIMMMIGNLSPFAQVLSWTKLKSGKCVYVLFQPF